MLSKGMTWREEDLLLHWTGSNWVPALVCESRNHCGVNDYGKDA